MSIFGWDYPPGVSSVPGDENFICEVCGGSEVSCVCPECPVCGDIGNIDCYNGHMVLNEEQRAAIIENARRYEDDCRKEAEYEAYMRKEFSLNEE